MPAARRSSGDTLRNIVDVSDTRRFDFAFAPRYRVLSRPFGIKPESAWVGVSEEILDVRFGPWHLTTTTANISDVAVTGPYALWKTAGPARLAATDRGLTFATNGTRGVRICFHRPVRGIEPLGLIRHPELTVTVADVEGLASLISIHASRPAEPARRPAGRAESEE